MAEKKSSSRKVDRVFIDAKTGEQVAAATVATDAKDVATEVRVNQAQPVGNPGPRRIIAIVLWIVAIVFEVLAVLVFNGTLEQNFPGNPLNWVVAFIVLDLLCVIIASQQWKKANHMDPPSEANKTAFFLKSQLGAILSVVAFLPLVILIFTDKNADKQMKTIGSIVAVVALLIGLGASIDYHPVSAEDLAETEQAAIELGDGKVYWTPYGHVYHLNPNCQAILNSSEITVGTAAEAYAAGRSRACKFCAEESGSDVMKELAQTENQTTTTPNTLGEASATGNSTDANEPTSDALDQAA